jgi:hypothetical protein
MAKPAKSPAVTWERTSVKFGIRVDVFTTEDTEGCEFGFLKESSLLSSCVLTSESEIVLPALLKRGFLAKPKRTDKSVPLPRLQTYIFAQLSGQAFRSSADFGICGISAW